ncbi:hypothetical protein ACQYWQ_17185 [Streptomyces sp. P6-2-1]|uniref:hypothetical protein n=1 Tax=unclassified Streptomyces TaxID=2593676 RepID=UPI003D362B33
MTEPEPRGGGWKRQGFIPVSRQSSEQPATPYSPPPPRGTAPTGDPAPGPAPEPPPDQRAAAPAPDRAGPDPSYEPVFARLWERWTTEGRTVPGEPDPEWAALARRSPWPR